MTVGETTWREVALTFPTAVQQYVQEVGPLPDGPVTQGAWDRFRAWASDRTDSGSSDAK